MTTKISVNNRLPDNPCLIMHTFLNSYQMSTVLSVEESNIVNSISKNDLKYIIVIAINLNIIIFYKWTSDRRLRVSAYVIILQSKHRL